MYDNKRLFLVFEYLELDLKKFMDTTPTLCHNRELIKVQSIPQSHSITPQMVIFVVRISHTALMHNKIGVLLLRRISVGEILLVPFPFSFPWHWMSV